MSSDDADHVFAEWQQGADGVWNRRAARTIAVATDGTPSGHGGGHGAADAEVLLLRGVDVHDPSHTWWFTPGGGIDEGESPREAAVRELFEESGLRVGPDDLVGPVAVRSAPFRYFGRPCRQDEVLYYVSITGHHDVHTGGWTAVERASVTDLRWWRLGDLAGTSETVYPPALPELVRALVTRGWDGTTPTIS